MAAADGYDIADVAADVIRHGFLLFDAIFFADALLFRC